MKYEDTGVSLDRAEQTVDRLRRHVESTFDRRVVSGFGHFAGVYALNGPEGSGPWLVASMDGVGTKVLLAETPEEHAVVAGDAVRHGANDCLAVGARPAFFLDYVAWGKLVPERMEDIVRGLAEACRAESCVLLGGETAEMPDLYREGDFDIAGCMIGVMDREHWVDGSRIGPGDAVVALPSIGLHTNGYSLARKVVERAGLERGSRLPHDGRPVAEALLAPHRTYTAALLPLIGDGLVRGLAHVTGGGISGNLVRILPEGCAARIDGGSWERPALFRDLQELGEIEESQMRSTFNLGAGFLLVIAAEKAATVQSRLRDGGEKPWRIGTIEAGRREVTWNG